MIDDAAYEVAFLKASDVLYEFTGRKWPGETSDTIRPVCDSCACWPDRWSNQRWACSGQRRRDGYVLPAFPVTGVTSLKIDGVTVSSSLYRVDDSRRLVAVRATAGDTLLRIPRCQDRTLPTTEVNTWEIEYTFGAEPPAGGVAAAASLGCQLALACYPADSECGKKCRLPKRVTSITRQGVSMAFLDPLSLFDEGKTGLEDVDLWVASVRYGDKHRPAAVYNPNDYVRRVVRSS